MANTAGRTMLVKKATTTIASVRTKSISRNGTPIDVTSDDDSGITAFLADTFADDTLQIEVSGLTDSDVLSGIAFSVTASDRHLDDLTFVLSSGDTIGGTFIMTAYTETGAYQGAIEFSATFVRSGIHTVTAA